MDADFTDAVVSLQKQNKWKEILRLGDICDNSTVHHNLLWVWPSEENLYFIQTHVNQNQCEGVTSVGCGCGLFEWLLHTSTGIPVNGFEINEEWWKSKYSKPHFIKLRFADPFPENCPVIGRRQALFFCYFNNHDAFTTYLNHFDGDMIFIIGPGEGRFTHTDPQPFKPNFVDSQWTLLGSQEIRNSKDYIAVYKRI